VSSDPPAAPWPVPAPAPVPLLRAGVHATAPPPDRSAGGSRWLALQGRPDQGAFLEGPAWGPDGQLYVVDPAWGRVLRVSPPGMVPVAAYGGQPNGLAFHPDGRAWVADYERGLLEFADLAAAGADAPAAPVTVLDRCGLDRFKGLNDVLVAPWGDTYLTDQGGTGLQDPSGRVYRLSTGGELRPLVDGIPSPNGLALDPARRLLYVAVTRDNAVWRVPLRADGSTAKVGRFLQLSGGGGPDGVAVTPGGGLLVTHLELGVVWLFDPRGVPVAAYECPGCPDPTNVVLTPDGAGALVTGGSGRVLRIELPGPGGGDGGDGRG
jgi:gluconolactonase